MNKLINSTAILKETPYSELKDVSFKITDTDTNELGETILCTDISHPEYKDTKLWVNISDVILHKTDEINYIGYFQSLDSSGILFSNNLQFLKDQWCFGMKIFEADDLTEVSLTLLFPDKPAMGTILKWLEENKKEVYSDGCMPITLK
jgi:hypothetical protein